MTTHKVYYSKGTQTLYTVPHKDGRPVRVASATYSILDTRYGESSELKTVVPAGTVAVVDPASTTLSFKAGSNASDPRVLTVASTAGFLPHHSYLLTSPDGQAELVPIVAVASGTALQAAANISGRFPAGSTLRGVEVAAVFPDTAADDKTKLDEMAWILTWSITGFAPKPELIFLVRADEGQLATLADLKELNSTLASRDVGGNKDITASALNRAHKTWRNDLRLAGATDGLLTGDLGNEAVTHLAAALILEISADEIDQKLAEQYRQRYNELRAALQTGALKPGVVNVEPTNETADKRNPAKLFRANGFM